MSKGIFFIDIEGGENSLECHLFTILHNSQTYKKYFLEFSRYSFVNYIWLPHPNKWEKLSGKDMAKLNLIKWPKEHDISFVILCDNDGQVNIKKMKQEADLISVYLRNKKNFPSKVVIKILLLPAGQTIEFLMALMLDPEKIKGKLRLNSSNSVEKMLKKISGWEDGKDKWTKEKDPISKIIKHNNAPNVFENMKINLNRFGNYTTIKIQSEHGDNFVAIDYIIENPDAKK